jgi:hypothetical protein
MKISFVAAVICSFASQASANVLAICDNLTGYSHHLDSNEIAPDFDKDGFEGRRIFLIENNNSGQLSYGIAWQDNGGEIQIDGSPTYLLNNNFSNRTFTFFVDGSRESFAELYIFQFSEPGGNASQRGSVVITQTRNGGLPKASIFHGSCTYSQN